MLQPQIFFILSHNSPKQGKTSVWSESIVFSVTTSTNTLLRFTSEKSKSRTNYIICMYEPQLYQNPRVNLSYALITK